MKLVLTCEHGGNSIPNAYRILFNGNQNILKSHKGYDLGALDVFNTLKELSDYSRSNITSRLLIEPNRSLHHKYLFSGISKPLSKLEKQNIIDHYYLPYRNHVEQAIKNFIEMNENVLHISVHTFTPTINQVERHCDIGLLYDSSRKLEKAICKQLQTEIKKLNPQLKVRFNYPYFGKSDGFTTYLRKLFPENYLGIELEINQKFSKNNRMDTSIKQVLFKALNQLI